MRKDILSEEGLLGTINKVLNDALAKKEICNLCGGSGKFDTEAGYFINCKCNDDLPKECEICQGKGKYLDNIGLPDEHWAVCECLLDGLDPDSYQDNLEDR